MRKIQRTVVVRAGSFSARVGATLGAIVATSMALVMPAFATTPGDRPPSIGSIPSVVQERGDDWPKPCNPQQPGGNFCASIVLKCDEVGGGLYNNPDGTIECIKP